MASKHLVEVEEAAMRLSELIDLAEAGDKKPVKFGASIGLWTIAPNLDEPISDDEPQ